MPHLKPNSQQMPTFSISCQKPYIQSPERNS